MRVAVLGTGLIGTSIGLARHRSRSSGLLVGYDIRRECAEQAKRLGAIDELADSVPMAVRSVDLVVVSVPIGAVIEVAREALTAAPGAVVMDVASVKASIVAALGAPRFVGAHPMAGSEHSGPDAARADLFDGATCAITPTEQTDPVAVSIVERFWRSIEVRSLRMTSETHDATVAVTSHIPHLSAFALARLFRRRPEDLPLEDLVGHAFRDATRVARSDPRLWREILLGNRELPAALDAFIEELRVLRVRIVHGEEAELERLLMEARAAIESVGGVRS